MMEPNEFLFQSKGRAHKFHFYSPETQDDQSHEKCPTKSKSPTESKRKQLLQDSPSKRSTSSLKQNQRLPPLPSNLTQKP